MRRELVKYTEEKKKQVWNHDFIFFLQIIVFSKICDVEYTFCTMITHYIGC